MRKFSNSSEVGFDSVPDVENRLAMRKVASNEFISAMKKMSAESRYMFFTRETAWRQEVWTLWDGNELPEMKYDDGWTVPVWTHRELALESSNNPSWLEVFSAPKAVPIPIDHWIDKFLLKEFEPDEVTLFVQPLPSTEALHIRVQDLLQGWYNEVKSFMINRDNFKDF